MELDENLRHKARLVARGYRIEVSLSITYPVSSNRNTSQVLKFKAIYSNNVLIWSQFWWKKYKNLVQVSKLSKSIGKT